MSTAWFWLTPILTVAACSMPDLAYKYVRRTYFPDADHIIQELDVAADEGKEKKGFHQKRKAFFKRIRAVGKARIAHTGFAFSQAPGARDLLYALGLAPLPKAQEGVEQAQEKGKQSDDDDNDDGSSSTVSQNEERPSFMGSYTHADDPPDEAEEKGTAKLRESVH